MSFVGQYETIGQMSKTTLWKEIYVSKNKIWEEESEKFLLIIKY